MTLRPLFVTLLVTGSVVFAQAAPVDPDHPSAIGRADGILVEALCISGPVSRTR